MSPAAVSSPSLTFLVRFMMCGGVSAVPDKFFGGIQYEARASRHVDASKKNSKSWLLKDAGIRCQFNHDFVSNPHKGMVTNHLRLVLQAR